MSSLAKEGLLLLPRQPPTPSSSQYNSSSFSPDASSHSPSATSRHPLYLAYIMLAICNIFFAAVGPTFLILMKEAKVGPLTAAAWRNQIMLFMVFPFAFIEWYRTDKSARAKWFIPVTHVRCPRFHVIGLVIASALGWCGNLIMFLPALTYTTTVRASLIVNTHPFILTLLYLLIGKKLGKWSVIGMLLCAGGLVLSEMPAITGAQDESKSGEDLLLGDLLCFGAAASDALYYFLCSRARKTVPVYSYTFMTLVVCTCGLSVASIIEQGYDNMFGYLFLDPVSLAYFTAFAFSIGVVGLAASNYTLGKLDSLIVSSASLSNPAITGLISYVTGLEGVPGIYTIIGGLVVILGLGVMSVGENKKKKRVVPVDGHITPDPLNSLTDI